MTRTRLLSGLLAAIAVLAAAGCGQQTAGSASASAGAAVVPARPSASGSGSGIGNDGMESAGAHRVHRLAVGEQEPRLECSRGDRSMMIADFAHGAPPAATPEDAVGLDLLQAGERMVLGRDGATAWVVRPDGSVRVEVGLLRHDGGWLLHQRTSCG